MLHVKNRIPTVRVWGWLCAALVAWQGLSCRGALVAPPLYSAAPAPANDEVCTAAREIGALLVDGQHVWAATPGGVLRVSESAQTKFTTQDGLPTHEIRALRKVDGDILALTPRGAARFNGARWQPSHLVSQPHFPVGVTAQTAWRGGMVRATVGNIVFEKNGKRQVLPWPDSKGSHVSAMLSRSAGGELWTAFFGDGLWIFDSKKWRRPRQPLIADSAAARETTAMAERNGHLVIGTRRGGVWRAEDDQFFPFDVPDKDEPFDHNAQAMATFRGALFVSTLEDGLSVRAGDGWQHVEAEMSSNAPRQLVEFGGALWVRHGGGAVDKCDGQAWTQNAFPVLPRKKVFALGGDDRRLYLGQWGGWSEWDGKTFTHHLNVPELQGLPPMALLPDGDRLWFATQSRGIAEVERATNKIRWHDERLGLPDDWITCLLKNGDEIFAGTFVGGLARWNGAKWEALPELAGENVTALENDGQGGIFIATRHGVWQRATDGKLSLLREHAPWLESEAQSLLKVPEGLWIGTRTGIFFLAKSPEK